MDNHNAQGETPQQARFNVDDRVWFVQSGNTERYVECPDCFGTCALTVVLGDGSQVSIDCSCCSEGFMGSRGRVKVWDWHCEATSAVVTGMEIDGERVRYKFAHVYIGDAKTFTTKAETEAEAIKVLAEHEADEAHRFANVKDNAGRQRTWAWNVSYHRREAKEGKRRMEYHESKLVVAKQKAKLPSEESK